MKKLLLSLMAIACFALSGHGKTNDNHEQISISGYVSDDVIKSFERDAIIRFYNHYSLRTSNEAEIIPINIKNNRFSITFNPAGEVGYFEFRGKYVASLFVDLFLVQAGDSIHIDMKDIDHVFFTGRGAEKMNYQLYGGKTIMAGFKSFKNNTTESRNFYEKWANDNWKLAMDSLDKIRSIIPSTIYDLLRINTTTAINSAYMLTLVGDFSDLDSVNRIDVLQKFKTMNRLQAGLAISDSFLVNNAFDYFQYIFTFENIYQKLLSGNFYNVVSMDKVYNTIKKQYSGILRDKLIAQCFLSYQQKSGGLALLSEALTFVTDSLSRAILLNFANSRTPGAIAYNFTFEGTDGKTIKLEDFKEKVVVVDTWFNGCPGCIELAKKMDPIMRRYLNKDVVFLSVSIDVMKKKFFEGVESGLYGSKQSKYCYTSGRGTSDPFIRYYKYYSYPNLLIVSKTGIVVSANPPTPFDEQRTKALIKLIDDSL